MARGRYLGDTLFDKMLQWKQSDMARQMQQNQMLEQRRVRKDQEVDNAIGMFMQVVEKQKAHEQAREAETQRMKVQKAQGAQKAYEFERELEMSEAQTQQRSAREQAKMQMQEQHKQQQMGLGAAKFGLAQEKEARQASQADERLRLMKQAFGLRKAGAQQKAATDVRGKETAVWNTTYDNLGKYTNFRNLLMLPSDVQDSVAKLVEHLPGLAAMAAKNPGRANQEVARLAQMYGLDLSALGATIAGGEAAPVEDDDAALLEELKQGL